MVGFNMIKQLLITSCDECPYYSKGVLGCLCHLSNEYINRTEHRIPEFCNLENYHNCEY